MPDYSAAAAVDYVAGLAARLSITEEQAHEVAMASWQFKHQRAVQAWDKYQAVQDAHCLEEKELQRQAEEDQGHRDEEERQRQAEELRQTQEEEERRRERELRQELQDRPAHVETARSDPHILDSAPPALAMPAANTFVFPTIGQELVSNRTDYGITEYAVTTLRDPTKLVNFWYFTHAGRKEAQMLALASVAEDASTGLHGTLDPATNTFSFSRVNATGKPSKNALPDASLSLRQLSEAKHFFAKYAEQCGWDADHIQAFVVLIMWLEGHDAPRCNPEFGERALVWYFADIHREYHTALALKAATIPDISVINEDRIDDILKEMINTAAMKTLADVRRMTELVSTSLVARLWALLPLSLHHPLTNNLLSLLHKPITHPLSLLSLLSLSLLSSSVHRLLDCQQLGVTSGTAPLSPLSREQAAQVSPVQRPGPSLRTGQRQPSGTRDRYSTVIPRSGTSSFQTGALGSATSACAVCLGRHTHYTRGCNTDKLHYHDKVRSYVRRGDNGKGLQRTSDGSKVCM